MKKYVSILFLAIYMISTNPQVFELVKSPLLITHFKEHKLWSPSISYVDFIYIHYLQDKNTFGDRARDNQMPFKTPEYSSVAIGVFIVPSRNFVEIKKDELLDPEKILIKDSSMFYTQYLKFIWHPPKAC